MTINGRSKTNPVLLTDPEYCATTQSQSQTVYRINRNGDITTLGGTETGEGEPRESTLRMGDRGKIGRTLIGITEGLEIHRDLPASKRGYFREHEGGGSFGEFCLRVTIRADGDRIGSFMYQNNTDVVIGKKGREVMSYEGKIYVIPGRESQVAVKVCHNDPVYEIAVAAKGGWYYYLREFLMLSDFTFTPRSGGTKKAVLKFRESAFSALTTGSKTSVPIYRAMNAVIKNHDPPTNNWIVVAFSSVQFPLTPADTKVFCDQAIARNVTTQAQLDNGEGHVHDLLKLSEACIETYGGSYAMLDDLCVARVQEKFLRDVKKYPYPVMVKNAATEKMEYAFDVSYFDSKGNFRPAAAADMSREVKMCIESSMNDQTTFGMWEVYAEWKTKGRKEKMKEGNINVRTYASEVIHEVRFNKDTPIPFLKALGLILADGEIEDEAVWEKMSRQRTSRVIRRIMMIENKFSLSKTTIVQVSTPQYEKKLKEAGKGYGGPRKFVATKKDVKVEDMEPEVEKKEDVKIENIEPEVEVNEDESDEESEEEPLFGGIDFDVGFDMDRVKNDDRVNFD